MEYIFFDKDDVQLYRRSDAIEAYHVVEEYKHTAVFPTDQDRLIVAGMRVGWIDELGDLLLFEIRQPKTSILEKTQSYEAEHIAIAELRDCIIRDRRAYNESAAVALARALEDTPWSVGIIDSTANGSSNFDYIDAWEAVTSIRTNWNVALMPRIEYSGNGITGKYIDIAPRYGAWRGVRLSLNRNISQAGVQYDDRSVKTALIGLGKGEVVGATESGDSTYGRKIKFEDVVWTAPDDPANKPAGQDYVEDIEATASLGRNGRMRVAEVVEGGEVMA